MKVTYSTFILQFDPLGGSSYIKLSKYFQKKKVIINMKNEDDMCASIDAFQEPLNLLIKSWEDQRT